MRPGLLFLFVASWPSSAAAQTVSVTAKTIYHAYQIQLFPGQDGPLRNLNRFYQTLDAGAWFLGPGGDIDVVLSFRYDTDFGTGFHVDTPNGAGIPASAYRHDLDLITFYAEWNDLIEHRLDLKLGRQVVLDDLDWYSFDGLKATVHLFDPGEDHLDFEAYAGLPVRWEQLFSSEPFINDGVQVDDAPGYFGGLTLGAAASFRMLGISASASYRHELIFRDDSLDAFANQPASAALSAGKYSVTESLIGLSAGYSYPDFGLDLYGRLTWDLLVGDLDQARAGVGLSPWRGFHFGAEYLRSQPRFLGDSIWNWFNTFAYDKARFEFSWRFIEWMEASVGYYLQFFHGSPIATGAGQSEGEYTIEYRGSDFNQGPSGGLNFYFSPLTAGLYFEGSSNITGDYAYGGNYRYGHAFVDAEFLEGFIGGTLRFSYTSFQNDWFEGLDEPQRTVDRSHDSYALLIGARSNIYDWVTLRLAFVKNFSSDLEGSYRIYSELGLHY